MLLANVYYGCFHYAEILGRSFPSNKLLRQADMLVERHGWRPESAVEWPYLLDIFLTTGTGGSLIVVLFALPEISVVWFVVFALWLRTTKRT